MKSSCFAFLSVRNNPPYILIFLELQIFQNCKKITNAMFLKNRNDCIQPPNLGVLQVRNLKRSNKLNKSFDKIPYSVRDVPTYIQLEFTLNFENSKFFIKIRIFEIQCTFWGPLLVPQCAVSQKILSLNFKKKISWEGGVRLVNLISDQKKSMRFL